MNEVTVVVPEEINHRFNRLTLVAATETALFFSTDECTTFVRRSQGEWTLIHLRPSDESIARIEQEALASLSRVESPKGEDAVNEERLPLEPSFL